MVFVNNLVNFYKLLIYPIKKYYIRNFSKLTPFYVYCFEMVKLLKFTCQEITIHISVTMLYREVLKKLEHFGFEIWEIYR